MSEVTKIEQAGELVTAANDLVDGLKVYLDTGELPELSSVFSRLAAILTLSGYILKLSPKIGAGANTLALVVDLTKLKHGYKNDDTDEIVESILSVVSDVSGVVAVIPVPQVKIYAIAIGASASSIKELYKRRKEITQLLTQLNADLSAFALKLKYDPSIYLDLPDSALRCHVVNGLNMNRSSVYGGSAYYAQNRLRPQFLTPPTTNRQRAAVLGPVAAEADELHRAFKHAYPDFGTGRSYLNPDFEWTGPERLQWRRITEF